MNKHAQALGRLGAGRKKTLSPDALNQRRKASQISLQKRLEKKMKINVDIAKALP